MTPSMFAALFAFLILQRLGELVLAERNRRWALAHGGQEYGRRTYAAMVTMHTLFYVALLLEWRLRSSGWNTLWPMWLMLLMAAQILRFWSIRSLDRCWNTRIIVVSGTSLVRKGPYRFVRHPNYTVVITELFVIPVLCGAYFTAAIFTLANALILGLRIPVEERALTQACGPALSRLPRFLPRFTSK